MKMRYASKEERQGLQKYIDSISIKTDINFWDIKETMKTKEERLRERVINTLKKLQSVNPDQRIYIETPNGTVSCRIGDAHIFESIDGQIAIDSE